MSGAEGGARPGSGDGPMLARVSDLLRGMRAELRSRVDGLADRVAVLEGRDPWQEAARSS